MPVPLAPATLMNVPGGATGLASMAPHCPVRHSRFSPPLPLNPSIQPPSPGAPSRLSPTEGSVALPRPMVSRPVASSGEEAEYVTCRTHVALGTNVDPQGLSLEPPSSYGVVVPG